ncbi:hypothetical protein CNO09_05920 (plasmid) [Borrelia miyamotoi]|uniref:Uncharacterized protein n=2 Tax=Borrelia miyamotoi TaxID=47466 RepID=A0AAQ3CP29_9SPIR|nr:hypothetical protein [Borrelia miyamotoi]MBW6186949.1 hypothetical protein [Pseudomonas aeruginosa]ATQ17895.1 hypothetical protein CNO12_06295 [Borrelia miyamotoi]ATQ20385.1 hypothetical protein CNO10_06295 [Borrelia miyamotoi]ATQ21594.1 hypothetical protein CNO09_05920 [Borrelia miyamotoi]QBK62556.1 hypothetical protein EZU67_05230 [Borrelia miyamotoi]
MGNIKLDVKQFIFKKVKSFIEFRVVKNFDALKSQIPGRLKDITCIESKELDKGLSIQIKVNSSLSKKLDSGEVYALNFIKPSLSRIKVWASYKGLSNAAIPIWLKLKNKGAFKKYTNWQKKDLQNKVKGLL